MWTLAGILCKSKCRSGIIVDDFNTIFPENYKLVGKYKLLDAWVALYGSMGPDRAIWGVGMELEGGLKVGRLDKVAILGLKPDEIEVL